MYMFYTSKLSFSSSITFSSAVAMRHVLFRFFIIACCCKQFRTHLLQSSPDIAIGDADPYPTSPFRLRKSSYRHLEENGRSSTQAPSSGGDSAAIVTLLNIDESSSPPAHDESDSMSTGSAKNGSVDSSSKEPATDTSSGVVVGTATNTVIVASEIPTQATWELLDFNVRPDDSKIQFVIGTIDDQKGGSLILNVSTKETNPAVFPEPSTFDIVISRLPEDYPTAKLSQSDFRDIGIGLPGSGTDSNNLQWCCSKESIGMGLCTAENAGNLLVDQAVFSGIHKSIEIPPIGAENSNLVFGGQVQPFLPGDYVIMFANCDTNGREVAVDGRIEWKHKAGISSSMKADSAKEAVLPNSSTEEPVVGSVLLPSEQPSQLKETSSAGDSLAGTTAMSSQQPSQLKETLSTVEPLVGSTVMPFQQPSQLLATMPPFATVATTILTLNPSLNPNQISSAIVTEVPANSPTEITVQQPTVSTAPAIPPLVASSKPSSIPVGGKETSSLVSSMPSDTLVANSVPPSISPMVQSSSTMQSKVTTAPPDEMPSSVIPASNNMLPTMMPSLSVPSVKPAGEAPSNDDMIDGEATKWPTASDPYKEPPTNYDSPTLIEPTVQPEPTTEYKPPPGDVEPAENDDEISKKWSEEDKSIKEKLLKLSKELVQDRNVVIVSIVLALLGLCMMLCIAQQMIENSDGLCAKLCRCILAFIRIVCCCFWCCLRRRSHQRLQRTDYDADSYEYGHDLELS